MPYVSNNAHDDSRERNYHTDDAREQPVTACQSPAIQTWDRDIWRGALISYDLANQYAAAN